MPFEGNYLNIRGITVSVSEDETTVVQVLDGLRNVVIVIRKHLSLDPLRAILQPALAISTTPETLEKNPGERMKPCESVIGEETRL